jgi:hypothetical protein
MERFAEDAQQLSQQAYIVYLSKLPDFVKDSHIMLARR